MKGEVKSLIKQSGLTVIELIATLVVGAIVVGIAATKARSVYMQQVEEQIISEVVEIANEAKKYRGDRPTYTGITCAILVTQEYLDPNWGNCTGVNPRGGNYTATANNTNASDLDVTATGLDTAQCGRIQRNIAPQVTASSCSGGTLSVTFSG